MLTDLQKQQDPNVFLAPFESQNPHYQSLKKMLALYRAMSEDLRLAHDPNGRQHRSPAPAIRACPQIRELLILTGDHPGGG